MKKSFSYSALKDFKGCARRYHAVRVAKMYSSPKTEAIIYGEVLHKACEEYIRDGKPLPDGLTKFQPALDKLNEMSGQKLCEYKMALNSDCSPVEFLAKDVWVRGIVDLLVLDGGQARIIDYKSGGAKYPDKDQLELMSLMVFEHFPEVQEVKAALLFLNHNVLVKARYKRENKDKLWRKWREGSDALDAAFAANAWSPNPTPLCRWCVVEHCEHHMR